LGHVVFAELGHFVGVLKTLKNEIFIFEQKEKVPEECFFFKYA